MRFRSPARWYSTCWAIAETRSTPSPPTALNCIYSAIESRQVEIATLRAIGFGGAPVVVSVMIEALLLSLLGGGLAYVYCDGASLSTLNFNTFSQVAFDFRVTPGLLLRGLTWALVIGLAGGLLPAVRAARAGALTTRRG